jgi:glycosyltransferase involved in cell wall biosynthesis/spore maturation protein CgeB
MPSRSILLLQTEPCTNNYYITLGIADALRRHPSVEKLVLATHGDAIHKFTTEHLDTFIAFGGCETHTDILARLCYLSELSILWTTEDPYQLAENVRQSTCFDVVFTNDKSSVSAYGQKAHHLPLAASELFQDFEVQKDDAQYLYDLLFVGTAWPNRVRSLNRILSAFDDRLKVKLALPWNDFIGPPLLQDHQMLTDWRCGNRDFARFANRSRVVLTLPRHFSASSEVQAVGSTPPPRLFEVALAGGFQIVVSPEPETSAYYEPDKEFVACSTEDQAILVIQEMLASPDKRIAMASRARERTMREHLYSNRVDEMLDLASRHSRRAHGSQSKNDRKIILFVAHNRLGYLEGGGVEIYQELISKHLTNYDIVFLFPAIKDERTLLCFEGNGVSRSFECATMGRDVLTDEMIESIFERILFEERIDLVHFHHLLYLPLSLPLLARACGLPIIWQVHDYYLICDHYNLLTFDRRFCDVANRGNDGCDACLLSFDERPPGTKARRDNFMALVVRTIDAFIASTPFSASYLCNFFHEITPAAVNIFGLPFDLGKVSFPDTATCDSARDGQLNVAIPGNFSEIKGGQYLLDLMRLCEDYDIHFWVFGHVQKHLSEPLSRLSAQRVTVIGGYAHEQVVPLLSRCHVSLHLSVWPETFMLSLTEAWAAGAVPIVTALGAPGERVTDGIDGFVVGPNDPAAAFGCLQQLYFDRGLLVRMRETISRKSFPNYGEHCDRLSVIYDGLISTKPCPHLRVPNQMPDVYRLSLFHTGIRLNSTRWTTRDNYWDVQAHGLGGGTGRPAAAQLCELPPAHYSLPEQAIDPLDSSALANIDVLEIDGRRRTTKTRDLAFQKVFLSGWMFARGRPPVERRYLRLRNQAWTGFIPLEFENRSDVATQFGAPYPQQLGFKATMEISSLQDGLYKADILQADNGRMLVFADALQFVVFGPNRFGAHHHLVWSAARSDIRGTDQAVMSTEDRAVVTRQNLAEIGGIAVGREFDTWWIEGVGLRKHAGTDQVIAVLENEDGDTSYTASVEPFDAAHASVEPTGFTVVGKIRTIEVGLYTLKLGYSGSDGLRLQSTDFQFFKAPGEVPFVWANAPPKALAGRSPGLGSLWLKRQRLEVKIDKFSTSSVLGPTEELLLVSGWAFAKGLGKPMYCVASWQQTGGRTRYCVAEPILRPDVANARGDSSALASGFEVGFPRNILETGTVRFFQCYPKATLEFAQFDSRLRAAMIDGV